MKVPLRNVWTGFEVILIFFSFMKFCMRFAQH